MDATQRYSAVAEGPIFQKSVAGGYDRKCLEEVGVEDGGGMERLVDICVMVVQSLGREVGIGSVQ